MSKGDRDTRLRAGERLLCDWGLGASPRVADLRGACGRDPAADLAIVARLGAIADPAAVEMLQGIAEASRDKLLVKEARRALYRLQQRGVAVPLPAPAARAPAIAPPVLEGYLSPVDGRGDQLVWLVKPRPGGVDHLFAVINDPDGLREIAVTDTTRKVLRAAEHDLRAQHQIHMHAADWRYCDALIARAFAWASAANRPVQGDYRGCRARLVQEPPHDVVDPVRAHLDPDATRADPALLRDSPLLLQEPEFRTWFIDPERLRPYLDAAREAQNSPLVLDPTQQQERLRMIVERAVDELWGGPVQASWVRRLEVMASVLHLAGRPEAARRAYAVALALAASTHGGRGIPFCETLVRSSLAAFMQLEAARDQEQARSSLVVTPQQAARAQQRRR